ncbi:MAG TPA: SRPBCC family protein [Pyrinomonadaceae bacterium]|jgi:hypothetical protein
MSDYEFVTIWRIEAPIEAVWEEIKNSQGWSEWWRGVLEVKEIKKGDENGIGNVFRSRWRSLLPYTLEFDSEVLRIENLKQIEARAFGELEGTGIWTLTAESEDVTRVRYDWRVKTTKAWMNWFAPIAKPFFRWNHDAIMRWGGEGLAKKLNCNLLKTKTS